MLSALVRGGSDKRQKLLPVKQFEQNAKLRSLSIVSLALLWEQSHWALSQICVELLCTCSCVLVYVKKQWFKCFANNGRVAIVLSKFITYILQQTSGCSMSNFIWNNSYHQYIYFGGRNHWFTRFLRPKKIVVN